MAGFFENYRPHLEELRTRLLRSLIALAIGFGAGWFVRHDLLYLLKRPLLSALPPESRHTILLGLTDKFFLDLKLAFYGGLFLVLPYLLYQVWAFLAPALYPHEKRLAKRGLWALLGFFALGMIFCYLVVLPVGFAMLVPYSMGVDETPFLADLLPIAGRTPDLLQIALPDYIDFVGTFILAFGLSFELPLVIFSLDRIGLVGAAWFAKQRRFAVVVIFIVAAILTPPDPGSQLSMALPLCLLYELGILAARLSPKKTAKTAS